MIQAEKTWRIAPKETHWHDQHQWPCNKLEVPTMYKAYIRPMQGNIPTKYGQKNGTVPPFLDPEDLPLTTLLRISLQTICQNHPMIVQLNASNCNLTISESKKTGPLFPLKGDMSKHHVWVLEGTSWFIPLCKLDLYIKICMYVL